MKQATILHDLNRDDLEGLFNRMLTRIDQLEKLFSPKQVDENMTIKEVMSYFKASKGTVENWTKQGKLKKYGTGGKVYYLRSEVEKAIVKL